MHCERSGRTRGISRPRDTRAREESVLESHSRRPQHINEVRENTGRTTYKNDLCSGAGLGFGFTATIQSGPSVPERLTAVETG